MGIGKKKDLRGDINSDIVDEPLQSNRVEKKDLFPKHMTVVVEGRRSS